MQIIVYFLLFFWLLYNVWHVLSAKRNAIEVSASSITNLPVEAAFFGYMKVRKFYLQLSPAHRKYEPHGVSLTEDVVIDVWETAGFQFVKHKYRVIELVKNQRMKLLSEASEVRVLGLFKGVNRSEVEFTFAPQGSSHTNLGLTICIVFPNALRHLLARLFFTQAIWQAHAKQEMNALASILFTRASSNAA